MPQRRKFRNSSVFLFTRPRLPPSTQTSKILSQVGQKFESPPKAAGALRGRLVAAQVACRFSLHGLSGTFPEFCRRWDKNSKVHRRRRGLCGAGRGLLRSRVVCSLRGLSSTSGILSQVGQKFESPPKAAGALRGRLVAAQVACRFSLHGLSSTSGILSQVGQKNGKFSEGRRGPAARRARAFCPPFRETRDSC